MLWWLVDHASSVNLLLGIAALIAGCLWWMTRKRGYGFAFLVTVALLIVVRLLSVFIVTDRMRIIQTVEAMARAVDQRNLDECFKHVSPQFKHDLMDAQQFRVYTEAQLRLHKVFKFHVFKISAEDVSRETGTGKARFWIDVEGAWDGEAPPLRCDATFVFERDMWLLKDFKVFLGNTSNEFRLPAAR
jgi:hypothetical protein